MAALHEIITVTEAEMTAAGGYYPLCQISSVFGFLGSPLTGKSSWPAPFCPACSPARPPGRKGKYNLQWGLLELVSDRPADSIVRMLDRYRDRPWHLDGLEASTQEYGGTLEIQKNAIATLSGVTEAGAFTMTQSSGTLKLHTGSTLNVFANGMANGSFSLSGGTLNIVADSPAGATDNAILGFTANKGALQVSGTATITFTTPANGWWAAGRQLYWTFEVKGNVTWNGGTYSPRVDGTTIGYDTLQIDGALTLGNNATMTI